ncbi:MAG: hypothetical protein QOH13_2589, partial [Thermoleophilaceae bacterium]|nr:hypothetical protein [Thermoleophilaceae bacterium]
MPAIRLRVLIGCIAGVSAGGLGLLAAGGPVQRASHPGGAAPAIERIDRAPIAFEPNAARTDPRVSFVARGKGYRLFLTRAEAVMALGGGDVVRTRLIGARRAAGPAGLERLPGVVNSYS